MRVCKAIAILFSRAGLALAIGLAWVVVYPVTASGQVNIGRRTTGASRPSLSSPSNYLQSNFAQITSNFGTAWSPTRVGRQVNTPTQLAPGILASGAGRRSPFGSQRLTAGGMQQTTSGRLLAPIGQRWGTQTSDWLRAARPGTLLSQVDATTFYGYSPIGYRGHALFDHDLTRYASWGMPEVVAKRPVADTAISAPTPAEPQVATTAPASPAEDSIPAVRMSMSELLTNQLDARSEFHETRAREAFRAEHYQEACSQFAIAESAAVRDPARRNYLKLAQVYASMAAQQYAEATNQLRSLLQGAPNEEPVDPAVFNRFRDVGAFYGNPSTYLQQCRALDQIGAVQPSEVGVLSLRALAAWGRNDVNTALPFARKVADLLQQPVQALDQQAKVQRDKALEARQQMDQARGAAAAAEDPDEVKKQREAERAQQDVAFTAEANEAKVQTQKRRLAALATLHQMLTEAVQTANAASGGIQPRLETRN